MRKKGFAITCLRRAGFQSRDLEPARCRGPVALTVRGGKTAGQAGNTLLPPIRHARKLQDSRWCLLADLYSVQLLVWAFGFGREAELSEDSHLYFWDRYSRLGRIHRAQGRLRKAKWCEQKAQEHYDATGLDGPPYAAAMALPRPRRLVVTHAVAGRSPGDPPEAA